MLSKTVAKTGEIEKSLLEEMEARMITAVKELANLQRNLTYNLTDDMHISSTPNNRNMFAKKWLISSLS